jgi:hypothetical protein
MSDEAILIASVLLGAIGSGYILYGIRQQKGMALASGVGLCVVAFLISNPWLLVPACVLLLMAPFVIQY